MTDKKNFADLGLSQVMLDAINRKGFEEPTTIQQMVIPALLQGETNLIAQAQTGTGKTAAFGLPLVELLKEKSRHTQALILTPTRELAIQVAEEISSLKGAKNLQIVPIYGGQSIDQQLRRLKKGAHIIVGTPGRVIDHLNRKTMKLSKIQYLVIDEADELMNMGFIEDLEEIMSHTSSERKTLLFSATMPQKIRQLAKKYMKGYTLLEDTRKQLTTHLTEQIYFEVRFTDKFDLLCRIVDFQDEFYGLVFCRTKTDVDTVTGRLVERGYDAEAIHGDISQMQRERTLSKFRAQHINILVATDVAARGIDVQNLTHVINYSLPHDPEAYVHRIGRTGRAGQQGTAITFITPKEYNKLMFIQKVARTDIKKSKIPTADDIIAAKTQKVRDDLMRLLEEPLEDRYYNWAKTLTAEKHPTEIIAALLNYCFEDDVNPESYRAIQQISSSGKQKRSPKPVDLHGKARLFVALGRRDKVTPRRLVDLILSRVTIKPRQISDIEVLDNFSFITVPYKHAEKIIFNFREKGQKPLITHVKKQK